MSLYIKLKIGFECLCTLFYLSVFMFVVFMKPCNGEISLVLVFESIICVLTSAFSITSIKDKVALKNQNAVHMVLGIVFILVLSYGFYLLQSSNCIVLWAFSVCFLVLGCLRFCDLIFCMRTYFDYYDDYVRIQEGDNAV